jgi:hypothetical protein
MKSPKNLPPVEQIEYYLGKDRYPNQFFKKEIPPCWDIKCTNGQVWLGLPWEDCKNSTVQFDGIEFEFNNLGYRSHYDYHVESLSKKKNILCIGDCYVFGLVNPYEELWTTQLQHMLPDYNVITMAMPTWSFDTVARVGVQTLQALSGCVEHVLVIPPDEHRREFVSKQYKNIISSHHTAVTNLPYQDYWEHIDWVSNNYNYFKNYFLLKSMTEAQGGKYTQLLLTVNDKNNRYHQDPDAVRGWPSGPLLQQAMATWFYKQILGLPSKFEELRG